MFVSRAAAAARLGSDKNRLRPIDAPASPISPPSSYDIKFDPALEATEIPDVDDYADPDFTTEVEAGEPKEEKSSIMELSELDKLINPRAAFPYRGKLEAQVGIAQTTILLGTGNAGRIFGISDKQSEAYSKGYRSGAELGLNPSRSTPPKPELRRRINILREEIAEQAAGKLRSTLGMLTDEKLSRIQKATNITKVARDLATVLERATPKEDENRGGVHFHIYRPDMQAAHDYETVTIDVDPSVHIPDPT